MGFSLPVVFSFITFSLSFFHLATDQNKSALNILIVKHQAVSALLYLYLTDLAQAWNDWVKGGGEGGGGKE